MNMFRFLTRFLGYYLAFLCVFLFFLSRDFLLEEGRGGVVEKLETQGSRGKEKPSIRTDKGDEVQCSYPFWREVRIGDQFFKKKWTFTYYLNEKPHSEFSEFFPFLMIASPLCALFLALKSSG
jgi:hypothetical protein